MSGGVKAAVSAVVAAADVTTSAVSLPSQGPVVSLSAAWDSSVAKRVWHAALVAMDDITADFARQAATVEAVATNRLRLTFEGTKELAKQSCEKPERKTKLEAALKKVSARDVLIEFAVSTSNGGDRRDVSPPKASSAVSRRQRMREAEQHPSVQQVMELFEAEIVRVDEPQQTPS